jgi:glycosyltransferase involved in cell wall biosynthesis
VSRFIHAEKAGYWGALRAVESAILSIRPDLIHIHAIWSLSSHAAAVCARRHGIPYVVAPRGMLEPWTLNSKRWKKRLALWLYQRRDLKLAALLHATAESESEQFRKLGFSQPVIVSANGVNAPGVLPERKFRGAGCRRLLFVSRIHYKKGLLVLVEAWARLRPSNWVLEIVGTDADGYQKVVERAVEQKGVADSVVFVGPLDDEKKWEAYRRADLFVLPTYSENFGIVVAEALFAEVPVITTKGTPWQELLGLYGVNASRAASLSCLSASTSSRSALPVSDSGRCGWWIDTGVDPLVEALEEAMALSDEERRQMGLNGRALVEQKYTWPAIALQMKSGYKSLSCV